MGVQITQYPYLRILGYLPIRQSSKGGFVFCREVRGHPHTGQAALMRAKFFALRLPVHSGRFGLS